MARNIYNLTGGSAANPGGVIPGAPTIIQVDVADTTPNAAGLPQKLISITYAPPSPLAGFNGVDVYLDAPDSSQSNLHIADGTVPADGTNPAGAAFSPQFILFFPYVSTNLIIQFTVPSPTINEYWRVYLTPATSTVTVPPIQYSQPGSGPSFQFIVTPPPANGAGTEYAPLVTNSALGALPSTYLPGWTANPNITVDVNGNQTWQFFAVWNWPILSQNLQALGGVQIVLQNNTTGVQTLLGQVPSNNIPYANFVSSQLPVNPGTTSYTVWLISYNTAGQQNSLISGVTPGISFNVIRSLGIAGEEYTALVLSDGVHPFITAATVVGSDGTSLLRVTGYWSNPADPAFGGAEIVVLKPDSNYYTVIAGRTSPITNDISNPASSQSWTFYLRSIDKQNNRNTISGVTPSVTITVGSSSGTLNLGAAQGSTYSSEFQIVAGVFKINQISANTIVTGQLQVGGGGGKVSEFKIFDTATPTASLIGWIGDDTSTSGFVGAWFKQMRIGGASPATAQITADSSGNVTINGNLIVGSNSIDIGTLGGGTLSSQNLPAGNILAGTISASILLTAPTLEITDGFGYCKIASSANGTSGTYIFIASSSGAALPWVSLTPSAILFEDSSLNQMRISASALLMSAVGGLSNLLQLFSSGGNGYINLVGGGVEVSGTQVVGARTTGWTAPTGSTQRGTWDTSSVPLVTLAQVVFALLTDLRTHGLIGT